MYWQREWKGEEVVMAGKENVLSRGEMEKEPRYFYNEKNKQWENVLPIEENLEEEWNRREWSPNSWRHFNWKTTQMRTGLHGIEVKAVAAQYGQADEDYYPMKVMITMTNGLASFNDSSDRVDIVQTGLVRQEAIDIIDRFDTKTYYELAKNT